MTFATSPANRLRNGHIDCRRRVPDVLIIRDHRDAVFPGAEYKLFRQLVAPFCVLFLPVDPNLQLVHPRGRIAGRFH